jgi:hypothetical protein
MKKLTALSLSAFATMAFTASALAQVPVSANDTDLILGFRVDDGNGTGANTDLEVDLGSYAQFTATSVVNSTGPTGLELADLTSTYGANWSTRGDLVFNVAGVTSTTNINHTAYVTQSGTPMNSTSAFGSASNLIAAEETELGSSATPTLDSTEAGTLGTAAAPATGIAGSLSYDAAQAGGEYSFFTVTSNVATDEAVIDGPLTTLDLYSYVVGSGRNGTPPTLLGAFTLTDAGTFTYAGADVAAAPEPSTWALMLGGAGLLFLGMRRRWISNLS